MSSLAILKPLAADGYQPANGTVADIAEADALHDRIVRANYPLAAEEIIELKNEFNFVQQGLQLALKHPKGLFRVVRDANHQLIAFSSALPLAIETGPFQGETVWDLSKLYVAPEHQKRGLGKRNVRSLLLADLIDAGQTAGVQRAYALTRKNYLSYPILRKLGFQEAPAPVQFPEYQALMREKGLVELLGDMNQLQRLTKLMNLLRL